MHVTIMIATTFAKDCSCGWEHKDWSWYGYQYGNHSKELFCSRGSRTVVLYQFNDFDFQGSIFQIIPFLQSISYCARQKNISAVTISLCQWRDGLSLIFSRSVSTALEWGLTCSYIAKNVCLAEFSFTITPEAVEDFPNLYWVQDLVQVKELRSLNIEESSSGIPRSWMEVMTDPDDGDEQSAEVCFHIQALITYLESEMFASPTTRP